MMSLKSTILHSTVSIDGDSFKRNLCNKIKKPEGSYCLLLCKHDYLIMTMTSFLILLESQSGYPNQRNKEPFKHNRFCKLILLSFTGLSYLTTKSRLLLCCQPRLSLRSYSIPLKIHSNLFTIQPLLCPGYRQRKFQLQLQLKLIITVKVKRRKQVGSEVKEG